MKSDLVDPPATCRVYVVELDRDVLRERKYRRANPGFLQQKLCLYVGSTALTPEERLRNHLLGHRANRYVYRYGLRLRPEFYRHYPLMGREEAELTERELAFELRDEGHAVWFNV